MDAPPRPLLLLLAWLALNLLQAGLSPLDADETYYWMYAQRLDWGYFDHPPVVALLISVGKDWLPGALGLRFGHVLAGGATVVGLYHLLGRPRGDDLWLAALLIFAQPLLHTYSFIATPDGPLLLFTVLYLLAFRRYLARPDWRSALLWGLTMAGLLYSKYHGVLLIFFSLLPFLPRLIRQPTAWLAALSGAALFLPHLYWQYLHDFPSFRYHLSGRNAAAYRPSFTTEYLVNQLLVFSPFLVYHYAVSLRMKWNKDLLARSSKWLILGLLLFFLYATSRGRAEAHWTALLSIPLVYLTFRAVRRRPKLRPLVVRLSLLTAGVLILLRLTLMAPRQWLPFAKPFDHQPWVERLAEEAGGLPVLFQNSYRLASLYRFYSGGLPSYTFTDVEYRLNQYDLWGGMADFQGRRVLVAGQYSWEEENSRLFPAGKSTLRLREVTNFQAASPVRLFASVAAPASARAGERLLIELRASSPIDLYRGTALPLDVYAILDYGNEQRIYWKIRGEVTTSIPAGRIHSIYSGPLHLPNNLTAGPASLRFGFGYRGMPPLDGQSHPIAVGIAPPRPLTDM